jgi:hypothetical protein
MVLVEKWKFQGRIDFIGGLNFGPITDRALQLGCGLGHFGPVDVLLRVSGFVKPL